MPRRAVLATLLIIAVGDPRMVAGQSPGVQYAYDELGRLVAVADQQSNVAIYRYDAVGNLLAIERIDGAALPGPVAIAALVPEKGKPGTVVSILGKGFGAAAAQNVAAFNGAAAPVTQASANRLIAIVPAGATSGPVTVTAPPGTAISPKPFRVVGALAVVPESATLGAGGAQSFTARDGDTETTAVRWAVDGVIAGNAELGTISSQGRYVAPQTIAVPRIVSVTATSNDDASVTATAVVTLQPPIPAHLVAADVGVTVDPGPSTLGAPGVGVHPASGGAGLTIVAPAVGFASPMRELSATAAPVSVRIQEAGAATSTEAVQ